MVKSNLQPMHPWLGNKCPDCRRELPPTDGFEFIAVCTCGYSDRGRLPNYNQAIDFRNVMNTTLFRRPPDTLQQSTGFCRCDPCSPWYLLLMVSSIATGMVGIFMVAYGSANPISITFILGLTLSLISVMAILVSKCGTQTNDYVVIE